MGHQKKKGAMLHVQHVQPLENRLRDTRTLAAYLSELSSSTFSMRTRIVSNFDWQACRLQSNFYSFSVCHTFRISWPPVIWYVLIGLETLLKGIKTFPRHIFFPFLILSSSYIFLSSKAAGSVLLTHQALQHHQNAIHLHVHCSPPLHWVCLRSSSRGESFDPYYFRLDQERCEHSFCYH